MLLQVVADSGNICGNLDSVCESNPGDLSKCRIRLLRCKSHDPGTNASSLRAALKGRCTGFFQLLLSALSDQLIHCGHLYRSISVISMSGRLDIPSPQRTLARIYSICTLASIFLKRIKNEGFIVQETQKTAPPTSSFVIMVRPSTFSLISSGSSRSPGSSLYRSTSL